MNRRRDNVLLTRRRWDYYFVPTFLLATAIAACDARGRAIPSIIVLSITLIPSWLFLRFTTRREGERVPSISSQPGLIQVLASGGAGLASFFILILIDRFVFGHRGRDLKPYHAVLFAPPFMVVVGGALWADRIRAKSQNIDDQNESGEREPTQKLASGE